MVLKTANLNKVSNEELIKILSLTLELKKTKQNFYDNKDLVSIVQTIKNELDKRNIYLADF